MFQRMGEGYLFLGNQKRDDIWCNNIFSNDICPNDKLAPWHLISLYFFVIAYFLHFLTDILWVWLMTFVLMTFGIMPFSLQHFFSIFFYWHKIYINDFCCSDICPIKICWKNSGSIDICSNYICSCDICQNSVFSSSDICSNEGLPGPGTNSLAYWVNL